MAAPAETHIAIRERNLERIRKCTVGIICAKAEEASGLLEALQPSVDEKELRTWEKIRSDDVALPGSRSVSFWIGQIGLGKLGSVDAYLTHASRQGIQGFGVEISSVLTVLQTSYILHAGTCAAHNTGL